MHGSAGQKRASQTRAWHGLSQLLNQQNFSPGPINHLKIWALYPQDEIRHLKYALFMNMHKVTYSESEYAEDLNQGKNLNRIELYRVP